MRVLLLAAIAACCGCGPKYELPPRLDDAVPNKVTGRNAERFTTSELHFGPYTAFAINRGLSRGDNLDPENEYPNDDSFSFAFKASSEWRGVCTTQRDSKTNVNKLACNCVDATSKSSTSVEAASETDELRGLVKTNDKSYVLHGSREQAGTKKKSAHATGYVLSEVTRPLAAIDVLGTGIVWLVPKISQAEKDAVACTAVALLLYH